MGKFSYFLVPNKKIEAKVAIGYVLVIVFIVSIIFFLGITAFKMTVKKKEPFMRL
jgi:hypothetical protein